MYQLYCKAECVCIFCKWISQYSSGRYESYIENNDTQSVYRLPNELFNEILS